MYRIHKYCLNNFSGEKWKGVEMGPPRSEQQGAREKWMSEAIYAAD